MHVGVHKSMLEGGVSERRGHYKHQRVPYIYRTASLLRPACCYAPPLFSGEITVKGYFTSITRPPAGCSSRFAVLQFCTCTRVASVEELYLCIKRVENSLRTGLGLFSLISDGFLRPSSWAAVAAGGRSLAARLPAMFCNVYVANNSSILQYCHGMSIEGVLVSSTALQSTRIRGRGGGGA